MKKFLLSALLAGLWLWRRKSTAGTTPGTTVPGGDKRLGTKILETGTALLQAKSPVYAINLYLDRFLHAAEDIARQLHTHHYCTRVNEDFIQCAIYDGSARDARLIGVEYIISERLYHTLPPEEQRLWHSHGYEVTSGIMYPPGATAGVERALMERMGNTYGKTWLTWDPARSSLPTGVPSLLMAFTADGQLDREMLEKRDRLYNTTSEALRETRRDIYVTPRSGAADPWANGRKLSLKLEENPVREEVPAGV